MWPCRRRDGAAASTRPPRRVDAPTPRRRRDRGAAAGAALEAFFFDRDAEIVAIVEGCDEITGRLVQARHSYAIENFRWWHNFAPCVFRQPGGSCLVDFSEFHRTSSSEGRTDSPRNDMIS